MAKYQLIRVDGQCPIGPVEFDFREPQRGDIFFYRTQEKELAEGNCYLEVLFICHYAVESLAAELYNLKPDIPMLICREINYDSLFEGHK